MISLYLVISKVESETYCTHAWWRHPISVSSEPEEQLHENEETVHTEATRQALAWSTTESGVPLGKVMMTDLSDPANTNGRTSRVANVSFILKILRKRSSNISFQMSWMYSARSQSKSDKELNASFQGSHDCMTIPFSLALPPQNNFTSPLDRKSVV